jgi:hypothetical protein
MLGSSQALSSARLPSLHGLSVARTAASKSLQLCSLKPFVPYMGAGTLNA